MNAIRDRLSAAVPPAPPSRVDIDQLVLSGRRTTRLRNTAVFAGTAGLVGTAIGLSVLVAPARSGSGQVVGGLGPQSAGTVGVPDSSRGGPGSPTVGGAPPGAVDTRVRYLLSSDAPQVTVVADEENGALQECQSIQGSPLPGRTAAPTCTPANYVSYRISYGAQRGVLLVSVHSDDGTGLTGCGAGGACTEIMVGQVRLVDLADDTWYNGHPVHHYSAIWPDGHVVEARAFGTWVDSGHTSYLDPPLTDAQVEAIALDVGLSGVALQPTPSGS